MAKHPPSLDPPTTESYDFTRRELQVAIAVAKGMSTGAIARQMNMKKQAIDLHLMRVYEKMSASLNVPITSLGQPEMYAWIISKSMPTNRPQKDRRALWTALRILALFPAGLAVLMYFVTPTYFRPMLDNFIGLVLLCILFATVCLDYALGEAVIWWFRQSRHALGVPALVGYSIVWLVSVSIVLLGPAALILIKAPS